MVTLKDFTHRLKSYNHIEVHNKNHHKKVLLSSFHLNVRILGFHPQTQQLLEPLNLLSTNGLAFSGHGCHGMCNGVQFRTTAKGIRQIPKLNNAVSCSVV